MRVDQIIITGKCQAEVKQIEISDTLPPGTMLMETQSTFISAGTECSIFSAVESAVYTKGSWCAYPWNSGYANVAKVLKTGDGVKGFKEGDLVFTNASHISHYFISPHAFAVKAPESVSPDIIAASRMAGVSTAALTVTDLGMTPWVVVFGLGMVGNLAAQACQIMGARVIGADPSPKRCSLAKECGIKNTVSGSPEEVQKAVEALTGGEMALITIDAVGHSAVVMQALKCTRSYGQIILLGSPRVPYEANLTDFLSDVHLRWLQVKGALEWNLPLRAIEAMNGGSRPDLSLVTKQERIFSWMEQGAYEDRTPYQPPHQAGRNSIRL